MNNGNPGKAAVRHLQDFLDFKKNPVFKNNIHDLGKDQDINVTNK